MDGTSGKTKKYNVYIAGISYQLVSSESEEYVRRIAALADLTINKILNSNASLSVSQATILAMVNFIDALKKTESKLVDAENEFSEIKGKELKMKTDLDTLRNGNFEIKKEVLRLNQLNRQLELEIAALRQQEITLPVNDFIYSENYGEDISDADYTENNPVKETPEENGVEDNQTPEEKGFAAKETPEEKGVDDIKMHEEDLAEDEEIIKESGNQDNLILKEETVGANSSSNDIVKDFLEDVEDPFSSPAADEEENANDNEMFHPLIQQSLEEI